MSPSIEPLHVEIGHAPLELHMLVSLAAADAHAVASAIRLMPDIGSLSSLSKTDKVKDALAEHQRRQDDLWNNVQRWEKTSLRLLAEVAYGIESGRHKLIEPELHAIRQTVARMRALTVDNLHARQGGPLTRDRLNLIMTGTHEPLARLAFSLDETRDTLPNDLIIDALTRSGESEDRNAEELTALVRMIRECRADFRAIQAAGIKVRVRLVHYSDTPAGMEHADEAIPESKRWLGKQPAGRHAGAGVARFTMLWTNDSEHSGFDDAVDRLSAIAQRGGRLLRSMRFSPAGWEFYNDDECWWMCLFEAAWACTHPTLRAEKQLWIDGESVGCGIVLLSRDTEKLRSILKKPWPVCSLIPRDWLDELPEAYLSDLDDAVWACMALCELIDKAGMAMAAEVAAVDPISVVGSTTPVAPIESIEQPSEARLRPALTPDHEKILAELARTPTKCRTVIDIAGSGPIRNRETVGRLLRDLAVYRLVHRPHGTKKGYAITEAGLEHMRDSKPPT